MNSFIYEVSKSLIKKGHYDKDKMKEDLSLFQMFNVISKEEYLELVKMIEGDKE